jgi:hypothetical protein
MSLFHNYNLILPFHYALSVNKHSQFLYVLYYVCISSVYSTL